MSLEPEGKGYDAAANSREEDHLGRWPVAKEIFHVASTCPLEWSVRIGVYGEWGSGKTSVLNFVRGMATAQKHIVVWFNPWQYADRQTMWKAFVVQVYAQLETITGETGRGLKTKVKSAATTMSNRFAKVVQQGVSLLNPGAGPVAEVGLEFLKRFLVFSADDLKGMREALGERRIMVLIDDLDRTNPDLVPEMLFAFKEIMDVPGLAFICAFDPAVIGKVLGKYHQGFGDGLKFLEKIIDYPRWLPEPSEAGMRALARAERERRQCSFVPLAVLEEAVLNLPRNPRVLRQFIRLVALLHPQIERHHDFELVWPIILTADALKVHHPHLAQDLFRNEVLLEAVAEVEIRLMSKEEAEKKEGIAKVIGEKLEEARGRLGIEISATEKERITSLLLRLAEVASPWRMPANMAFYQLHIAEAPHAVTWKEYDNLVACFKEEKTPEAISAWIGSHAAKVERAEDDVFRGLLHAAAQRRSSALNEVVDIKIITDMDTALESASTSMSLLENLVFSLGRLDQVAKRLGEEELGVLLKAMLDFQEWSSFKVLRSHRESAKAFLLRLFDAWTGDVVPLLRILKASGSSREPLIGKHEKALRAKLAAIAMPRFAHQTLQRFTEEGFVQRIFREDEGAYEARRLLLSVDGALWKGLRRGVLHVLDRAKGDPIIHRNALELVYRFDHMLRNAPGQQDTLAVEELLKNKRIARAVWKAAVVERLNPRMVGQLRGFPEILKNFGVTVGVPEWWSITIRQLDGS